ncbi:MAG: hypothetical protein E6640_01920 [Actinomyces urogenitalis]|uniref:hypothetical protein n=1 Tax=Actinomyces urogenitalis TaxID=103621 RepID=UPI00290D2965|nr:hypothetical protein [Actinomyces urogenitalis]MDU6150969.1 hypothetical protein [Actinomyces urogenitalis]
MRRRRFVLAVPAVMVLAACTGGGAGGGAGGAAVRQTEAPPSPTPTDQWAPAGPADGDEPDQAAHQMVRRAGLARKNGDVSASPRQDWSEAGWERFVADCQARKAQMDAFKTRYGTDLHSISVAKWEETTEVTDSRCAVTMFTLTFEGEGPYSMDGLTKDSSIAESFTGLLVRDGGRWVIDALYSAQEMREQGLYHS